MYTRETPLETPDNRLYFRVRLEGKSEHVFRIPRLTVLAGLVTLIPPEQLEAITTDAGTVLESIAKVGAAFDPMCAILATCWAHETVAIEHVAVGNPTVDGAAYGEEFHEAGYTTPEVIALFGAVYTELVKSLTRIEESEERAANFPSPGIGGDSKPLPAP